MVALGQLLRHFATRIDPAVGEDHGKRVRHWFEDKKAGWYAVLEDPQMPAMGIVKLMPKFIHLCRNKKNKAL